MAFCKRYIYFIRICVADLPIYTMKFDFQKLNKVIKMLQFYYSFKNCEAMLKLSQFVDHIIDYIAQPMSSNQNLLSAVCRNRNYFHNETWHLTFVFHNLKFCGVVGYGLFLKCYFERKKWGHFRRAKRFAWKNPFIVVIWIKCNPKK